MKNFRFILFLILLFCNYTLVFAQKIELRISEIRSAKGNLMLAAFPDNDSFINETPSLTKLINKDDMSNGVITIYIDIPTNICGITVFDDENSDGKLNYNLLGIPREGIGFSNYIHRGLRKPNFCSFSFIICNQRVLNVSVIMKYY